MLTCIVHESWGRATVFPAFPVASGGTVGTGRTSPPTRSRFWRTAPRERPECLAAGSVARTTSTIRLTVSGFVAQVSRPVTASQVWRPVPQDQDRTPSTGTCMRCDPDSARSRGAVRQDLLRVGQGVRTIWAERAGRRSGSRGRIRRKSIQNGVLHRFRLMRSVAAPQLLFRLSPKLRLARPQPTITLDVASATPTGGSPRSRRVRAAGRTTGRIGAIGRQVLAELSTAGYDATSRGAFRRTRPVTPTTRRCRTRLPGQV